MEKNCAKLIAKERERESRKLKCVFGAEGKKLCKKQKIEKTPLRLYLDRQPIDPADIVEMVAAASRTHYLVNRINVLLFVIAFALLPVFLILSLTPPAF